MAEYIQSLPEHLEERRRPQAMTSAMSSLLERVSGELHGVIYTDSFIESNQGLIYLKPVNDNVVILVDWRDDIQINALLREWTEIQQTLELLENYLLSVL